MATKLQIANLESRETRNRLPVGHKPYWQSLNRRCYLGYCKGGELRIWIARFVARDGRPDDHRIGLVDDAEAADGVQVLDFKQAAMVTQNWYRERAIEEAGLPMDDSPFNKIGAACNRI